MKGAVPLVFRLLLVRGRVPLPELEYRFHPTRRFRLDFAWPSQRLGLEVQGGVWVRGKHGRGSGIVKDHDKGNALACLGWRLLQVQPAALATPGTVAMIREALACE